MSVDSYLPSLGVLNQHEEQFELDRVFFIVYAMYSLPFRLIVCKHVSPSFYDATECTVSGLQGSHGLK